MKKFIILWVFISLNSIAASSQNLGHLDFISPFHDGLSAIQKDGKWGFINTEGELVIDYRADLVLTTFGDDHYPVFNSGRCLIVNKDKGISYYGYIDKTGKTSIEPQFLNATNFNSGLAIILKLHKNGLGKNDLLDKNMVDYSYTELAINVNAETVHYLSEKPTHITLSKKFLKAPPEIKAQFISEGVIATKNDDDTWSIKKV